MAMMTGGSRSTVGAINVTPLIDILLVLLIIFMVITPVQSVGLEAQAPQPAPNEVNAEPDPTTIVVQIDRESRITINTEQVTADQLGVRLKDIFKSRAMRVVFLKADLDL